MIDRAQAKQAARNCMRTARISPYQIGVLYIVIAFALSAFEETMMRLFGVPYYLDVYTMIRIPSGINCFIAILVSLLSITLEAGFVTYCLGIRRGKEMPLTTLFDGFSIVGKVILLNIVMGIFIFLWSLLFFIPGIIAAYRYSFALYNLLENPDIGIMEAIRLSKEQTRGYKWDLFVLDLSFLGWFILDAFTLGFLGIWLQPYYTLTHIAFYDTICAGKGMTAGGSGGGGWAQNDPQNDPPQYDYDWNHQNNNWNSAGSGTGTEAPTRQPEQPQTPPVLQMPEPPAAPEVPKRPDSNPGAEPWERKENQEPWNRGDQNAP